MPSYLSLASLKSASQLLQPENSEDCSTAWILPDNHITSISEINTTEPLVKGALSTFQINKSIFSPDNTVLRQLRTIVVKLESFVVLKFCEQLLREFVDAMVVDIESSFNKAMELLMITFLSFRDVNAIIMFRLYSLQDSHVQNVNDCSKFKKTPHNNLPSDQLSDDRHNFKHPPIEYNAMSNEPHPLEVNTSVKWNQQATKWHLVPGHVPSGTKILKKSQQSWVTFTETRCSDNNNSCAHHSEPSVVWRAILPVLFILPWTTSAVTGCQSRLIKWFTFYF